MENSEKHTLVVNIFGGPGAGKSTLAFDLCARLKRKRIVTELAPEAAKEIVWDNPKDTKIKHQLHLFAEQQKRIDRLLGKVDVIVTDSPIPNFLLFDTTGNKFYPDLIMAEFNKTWNLNLLCKRAVPYEQEGRYQTEEKAKQMDKFLEDILFDKGIPYHKTDSTETSGKYITGLIETELKQ